MKRIFWLIVKTLFLLFFVLGLTIYAMSPGFKVLLSHVVSKIEKELIDHCIIPSDKSSCHLDKKKLNQKMDNDLPHWAKAQIETDLKAFPIVYRSEIKQIPQDPRFNMLFYFQIKGGKVLSKHREELNVLPAYPVIVDVLQYLADKKMIPDTEFLMGLGDYFKTSEKPPVPIFVFAKDLSDPFEKDLILMPDWMNLRSATKLRTEIRDANQIFPFEQKKPLLFWRGSEASSTGFRSELVALSKRYPEQIDAKIVDKYRVKFVEPKDHLQYRYLITADGVRATWVRLVWHLHSNSLVLKHDSSQVQWFYNGILPYQHYVPVQDTDDILKKIAWANTHPQEVKSMIEASTAFVEDNIAVEDMYHYISVLLQEYTKRLRD